MAKITKYGGASFDPAGAGPPPGFVAEWSDEEHDHPGMGEPMEGIEVAPGETGVLEADGAPGAEEIRPTEDGEADPGPAVYVDEVRESPSVDEIEAEGDDIGNDAEPDAEPVAAALPRPATNASKAEWLAYAEAVTGEDCDGYTKAELIELVGKE